RQDILIDSRNSNVRSRFDWQTRISPRNSLLDGRRSRQKTDRCPTQSVCVRTCCRSFHAVLQTPGSHSLDELRQKVVGRLTGPTRRAAPWADNLRSDGRGCSDFLSRYILPPVHRNRTNRTASATPFSTWLQCNRMCAVSPC